MYVIANIWNFLVNGGSQFIGDFEVNPSGDPSFDITGPTRSSANGGFSNTGLELTPDSFENLSPNPFENQIPFENDAPNLPISKYTYGIDKREKLVPAVVFWGA